ncbi:MAG TPA: winged helix-turn-helix domain-containing protein [Methanomassiliicoccales archaeon]|nr:winged helix-turn-helix domain-containing protein [Methanomassiliicoccales archaeon]
MRQATPKRSRVDLYAEVLQVITRYPEGARITRLSYGVGMPVDRLKRLLESLVSYSLVHRIEEDEEVVYRVTPRGLDFIDTYWKMNGFLEEFGQGSGQE